MLIAVGGNAVEVDTEGVVWIKWLERGDDLPFVKVYMGRSVWSLAVHSGTGVIAVGCNSQTVTLLRICKDQQSREVEGGEEELEEGEVG